jgi:hypothetical protein
LLNNTLQGIKIGHRTVKTKVVAYADYVTVFLKTPQDISTLQEAIQQYEEASGAQINLRESTAIPLGTWDTNYPISKRYNDSGDRGEENDGRNEYDELE